jgi:hypothetical protein
MALETIIFILIHYNHLKKSKTYLEHFNDGTTFYYLSIKTPFYFLIYLLWLDLCEYDDSKTVKELYTMLEEK